MRPAGRNTMKTGKKNTAKPARPEIERGIERGTHTHYIFITGGVVSSLGKGVTAAALGALLQAYGCRVRIRKIDPYLNIDPGTMNPREHGEIFVTEDGTEADLDLGHYERFLNIETTRDDTVTAGKLLEGLLRREREGVDFTGQTVQIIPHVTEAIKNFIRYQPSFVDFCIYEIGGTVGDIESLPFLEALRQFRNEIGRSRTLFVHMTLLPYLEAAQELKSKPTQHSVKELLSTGLQPDIILLRGSRPIKEALFRKISQMCSIEDGHVFPVLDRDNILEMPLAFAQDGLDRRILSHFQLADTYKKPALEPWCQLSQASRNCEGTVKIALVGKYLEVVDAYKSLGEALYHAGLATRRRIETHFIEAEHLENQATIPETLQACDGILVPGGFGERGWQGKMRAVQYAREHHVPYLGICFGMQIACIEYARNVMGWLDAGSEEFETTPAPAPAAETEKTTPPVVIKPVVIKLETWLKNNQLQSRQPKIKPENLGGTMRLGSYTCRLQPDSLAWRIYRQTLVAERHRHRYELDPGVARNLEAHGMRVSGWAEHDDLPEMVELPSHPWFLGVQFHPEFRSRPFEPHPVFVHFIRAADQRFRLL